MCINMHMQTNVHTCRYYDTPEELVVTVDILLRNESLRNQISASQRSFFAAEMVSS